MADHTKIEWTDATWNPITGCDVVSPGCTNCYAMKLAGTRLAHHPSRAGLTRDTKAGPVWTGEMRFNEHWLTQPLAWKKPRMIFVCAHGDLFAENVPDEWIDRVFAVMACAPQHTFQVLTKRAARMRQYMKRGGPTLQQLAQTPQVGHGLMTANTDWPLPNVWLGVSAEDQFRFDDRVTDLEQTPAQVRFVSAEPLLSPIDVSWFDVDWIIVGGESGVDARPMHPDWARSIRDQCARADIPFFFKQWGEYGPSEMHPTGVAPLSVVASNGRHLRGAARLTEELSDKNAEIIAKFGKTRAGRLLDGRAHSDMPRRAA